ncbi:MAG: hypothetical protein U9P71_08475 [Campylobacterota bacterium]|nr:hypothetical protein [Campylobacterota bacterium]
MFILLPMDSDNTQEGKLVSLNDVKKWALIEFDAGEVIEIKYFDTREEIEELIEIVVVVSDNEYVWPFIENQIIVLVAHTQRSIDEVMESFIFKELHEMAY